MKKVLAVLAVAGLASSAMAQSFDGQLGFRLDQGTTNDPVVPNVIEVTPGGPGTYSMSVVLGAFNAQGFTNYGMVNWLGNLSVAGGGASLSTGGTAAALRGPFTQNPVGNGIVSPDGTTISGIDAARPITNVAVPWLDGQPQPTNPPTFTQGNNAFFQTYRFTLTLSDVNTPRDIVITGTGPMQAVSGWTQVGVNPPEEEVPGSVNWAGTAQVQDDSVAGSFIIRIVPAPGAAALLGLGGLLAARRRRA